jgi:hypothetical protein
MTVLSKAGARPKIPIRRSVGQVEDPLGISRPRKPGHFHFKAGALPKIPMLPGVSCVRTWLKAPSVRSQGRRQSSSGLFAFSAACLAGSYLRLARITGRVRGPSRAWPFSFAPKRPSPAAASINGLAIMALQGRARVFGAVRP